jgi:hypothetical protein
LEKPMNQSLRERTCVKDVTAVFGSRTPADHLLKRLILRPSDRSGRRS